MLDSLSPQRRRVVLVTAALAGLLVVTLVAMAVVRSIAGASDPVPQDQPGPVLLVPGYGGRVASLDPLAAALRAAGREVVVVERLGDGTGDLRAEAGQLQDVAEQTLEKTRASSVDVVGYSAGGVVARLWVRDYGGAGLARRVLTLGSPHHGTSQAAMGRELAGGCPTACEQLVPDSDLLRRLNAGDETPDGPLWATVRSTGDQVVTPVDSAALEGAVNILVQEVCPGATASHGELPGHPVTEAALTSVLGAESPRAPTSTC
jgi:alpha-beta hydrolase superfamily lysophospholipase